MARTEKQDSASTAKCKGWIPADTTEYERVSAAVTCRIGGAVPQSEREDLVAQILVEVASTYAPSKGASITTWAVTVTDARIKDWLRAKKSRPTVEDFDGAMTDGQDATQPDLSFDYEHDSLVDARASDKLLADWSHELTHCAEMFAIAAETHEHSGLMAVAEILEVIAHEFRGHIDHECEDSSPWGQPSLKDLREAVLQGDVSKIAEYGRALKRLHNGNALMEFVDLARKHRKNKLLGLPPVPESTKPVVDVLDKARTRWAETKPVDVNGALLIVVYLVQSLPWLAPLSEGEMPRFRRAAKSALAAHLAGKDPIKAALTCLGVTPKMWKATGATDRKRASRAKKSVTRDGASHSRFRITRYANSKHSKS